MPDLLGAVKNGVASGPEEAIASIREYLQTIRFGSIALTIHEGRIVQLDVTEKRRLTASPAWLPNQEMPTGPPEALRSNTGGTMIARLALLSGSALLTLAASPALRPGFGRARRSRPRSRQWLRLPIRPTRRQPPAAADSGDIVITARRRNESLQDVPLAVSVIGDERLTTTGSFNVLRLSQIQPSLQFYSTNPRNSSANIRGLGSPFGLTNDGIEQGVGVYVDQVYYSRIASTTFDFLDVERVEVLRGPQGTLYGKNTTAGAVNLISRPPSFDPEGRAELSIGNLGYVQARASLSGPIVADTLAIRVAGSATRRRGTVFNVTSGNWVNELENTGVRAALLWRRVAASQHHPVRRLQLPEPRMLRTNLRAHRRRPSGR